MTRNKYAALSFIPVTAARHDFGDASQRRKRNLAFSFVFRTIRGRASIEQRRRRMTQPASSWHCRSGYMMPLLPPNNQIQLTAAATVTWNPFSAPRLPPARCQLIFCARYTFKALNIIHYNAVHSRHLACGMRQAHNFHSAPPRSPLQPSTDQVPYFFNSIGMYF